MDTSETSAQHQADTPVDPQFQAKHFEGHGDRWGVIGEDPPHGLAEALSLFMNSDDLRVLKTPVDPHDMLLTPPGDCGAAALIRPTPDGAILITSFFPLLRGLPNPLIIDHVRSWNEVKDAEGEVLAHVEGGAEPSISFFDPYFAFDAPRLVVGSKQQIFLAGLAYSLQKAPERILPLNPKSPAYRYLRRKYPEQDKTITFSTKGMRALLGTDYVADWAFYFPVDEVCATSLCGHAMYRIRSVFLGDGYDLQGYLYASETILNGYVPQVGDDIEGRLWLSGHLQQEGEPAAPPSAD